MPEPAAPAPRRAALPGRPLPPRPPVTVLLPAGLSGTELLERLGGAGAPYADAFPELYSARSLVDAGLEALAVAALAEWPSWFETGEAPDGASPGALLPLDGSVPGARKAILRAARAALADPGWLEAALTHGVFLGTPPCFPDAPAELQARQLSLALGRRRGILRVFPPRERGPSDVSLRDYARGIEWLAGETGMLVVALVPGAHRDRSGLESLLRRCRELPGPGEALGPETLGGPGSPPTPATPGGRGPAAGPPARTPEGGGEASAAGGSGGKAAAVPMAAAAGGHGDTPPSGTLPAGSRRRPGSSAGQDTGRALPVRIPGAEGRGEAAAAGGGKKSEPVPGGPTAGDSCDATPSGPAPAASRPEPDAGGPGACDGGGRAGRGSNPFRDMEGSPNPRSPGEMLLAERLAGEPDLAGLFEFNAAVDAAGGGRFIADLLWREGRLVIEVDGYGPHSSLQAFCRDRDRDFRLLLSGYRVVRIPHGELSASPEGALGKIRMAVRYVRGLAP